MPSEVTISVDVREATTVIFLGGDLDRDGAEQLKQRLGGLSFGRGPQRVIIDMSGVLFSDSAGLDVIMDTHDWCQARGVAFSLSNPSPLLGRMLTATGDAARLSIVRGRLASTPSARIDSRSKGAEVADEREAVADRRDRRADERDRLADERDVHADAHALDVTAIMAAAAGRDAAAERRDRAAEGRDAVAIHRHGRLDADKHDANIAAIDRWYAGTDRDASAQDRVELARLWREDSAGGEPRIAAAVQREVDGDAREQAVLERTRVAMNGEGVGSDSQT